jgi:4-diphosphocytidyl-2-C-methyl-D-erythritol kinase
MPDEARARDALERLPRRWTGYVVRGLNRSPLLARLQLEQRGPGAAR